jgi:hypothetical protein
MNPILFLVQITPDDTTRMLGDDELLRDGVEAVIHSLATIYTRGAAPEVKVAHLKYPDGLKSLAFKQ